MAPAPSVCSTPGCPELAPCPTHRPRQTSGTERRQQRGILGSGWDERDRNRRTIRHHHGICWWCGHPDATVVDHVTELADGGTDSQANRRPIHQSCPHCGQRCHQDKTTQATRARRRTPGG